MRIDKYLKLSRIIKRREVAKNACDSGRVLVNGSSVKPSFNVEIGDKLEVRFASSIRHFVVLSTEQAKVKTRGDSLGMYSEIQQNGTQAANSGCDV